MENQMLFYTTIKSLEAQVVEMKSLGREGREVLGVALAGRGEEMQVGSTSVSAGSQGGSKKCEDCGPEVPGVAWGFWKSDSQRQLQALRQEKGKKEKKRLVSSLALETIMSAEN